MVELEAGETLSCDLTGSDRYIRGRVENLRGRPVPDAIVRSCNGFASVESDGTFRLMAPQRPCEIRAGVQDGLLARWSGGEDIGPFSNGRDIVLVVDDGPVGGMGIALDVDEGGVHVDDVHPGSPAMRAGLRSGDTIVAIDGESTAGMGSYDFISRGVGTPGTPVTLEVERDGSIREVTMTRALIEEKEFEPEGDAKDEPEFEPETEEEPEQESEEDREPEDESWYPDTGW